MQDFRGVIASMGNEEREKQKKIMVSPNHEDLSFAIFTSYIILLFRRHLRSVTLQKCCI